MKIEASGVSCESKGSVSYTDGELLSCQVPGRSHWSCACAGYPGLQRDKR